MSSIQSIETPQDYVNYTFNLSSRGVTEVTSELAGMSSTVSNLMGLMAFKTSEYLSNTEALITSFGYAAVATFSKATSQAIQFEQALANVKAIGGESINEIEIGQAAMQYSNQLGMSVSSMTEGLEALSRAGLTATDVMSNVLAEGVKLSKLEGMDLEDSINNLISTTNLLAEGGYDVNTQEYADMVKAMNQHIVSTSESAPINAHNIIQTLQHVGGYASASGIDQDDLFAVIAQLGSKGTKGEMAGTALRAFIAAGQKDSAQRALKRIGLDVTDLWTESGEAMLPVSEMKAVLDEALESRGYSKQEKLEFYSDFAGYKQANQIMKINTEEVQQYKKSIDQAWDLGRKLDEILGTVHSNIQIIAQTTTNFLTRVGQTALPILNAILQPIKWAVQLIDKIPFSEQFVGLGLAFVGLKGIFTFINRVVPAVASLYTSFDRPEKKAKGIAGHFKNLKRDALETKETIENIKNPEFLARKRMENDKYGMGSVEYGLAVAEDMYGSVRGRDITGKDFWELSKYQRNQFIDYVVSLGKDKQIYQTTQDRIDAENQALAQAIIDSEAKSQPIVYQVDKGNNWTGNVERNQEINLQRQSYKESTDQAKKSNDIAASTKQSVDNVLNVTKELISHIKGHTDNTKQYDIGKGIMSVAKPLADIFAETIFKRFNLKEFNTRAGKIQFDSDVGKQASQELENIFNKVQNAISDLPDISFHYDNDIEKMQDKVKTLRSEIATTAKIFSNIDISNMTPYQGRRALKTIDIKAMGNIGLDYSKMMNEAYIREVLKQDNFDKNNKFIEKIYDEQVTKLAESLNVDISSAKNKIDAVEKIYNKFHEKGQRKSIAEVVQSSKDWYDTHLTERKIPSIKELTNDDSKYIMERLGIQYNANNDVTQQLQTYFSSKDVDASTKWMAQELVLAIQKQKAEGVYSGPEKAELEYMVTHLEALNQSINRLNNDTALTRTIVVDTPLTGRDELGPWLNNFRKSNSSFDPAFFDPSKSNIQRILQNFLKHGYAGIDRTLPTAGISIQGDVLVNDAKMPLDKSNSIITELFKTYIHEIAHAVLNHEKRYLTPSLTNNPIPYSKGNVVQESEARMVEVAISKMLGIQDAQQQRILNKLKLSAEKQNVSYAINDELVNSLIVAMANNLPSIMEHFATLASTSDYVNPNTYRKEIYDMYRPSLYRDSSILNESSLQELEEERADYEELIKELKDSLNDYKKYNEDTGEYYIDMNDENVITILADIADYQSMLVDTNEQIHKLEDKKETVDPRPEAMAQTIEKDKLEHALSSTTKPTIKDNVFAAAKDIQTKEQKIDTIIALLDAINQYTYAMMNKVLDTSKMTGRAKARLPKQFILDDFHPKATTNLYGESIDSTQGITKKPKITSQEEWLRLDKIRRDNLKKSQEQQKEIYRKERQRDSKFISASTIRARQREQIIKEEKSIDEENRRLIEEEKKKLKNQKRINIDGKWVINPAYDPSAKTRTPIGKSVLSGSTITAYERTMYRKPLPFESKSITEERNRFFREQIENLGLNLAPYQQQNKKQNSIPFLSENKERLARMNMDYNEEDEQKYMNDFAGGYSPLMEEALLNTQPLSPKKSPEEQLDELFNYKHPRKKHIIKKKNKNLTFIHQFYKGIRQLNESYTELAEELEKTIKEQEQELYDTIDKQNKEFIIAHNALHPKNQKPILVNPYTGQQINVSRDKDHKDTSIYGAQEYFDAIDRKSKFFGYDETATSKRRLINEALKKQYETGETPNVPSVRFIKGKYTNLGFDVTKISKILLDKVNDNIQLTQQEINHALMLGFKNIISKDAINKAKQGIVLPAEQLKIALEMGINNIVELNEENIKLAKETDKLQATFDEYNANVTYVRKKVLEAEIKQYDEATKWAVNQAQEIFGQDFQVKKSGKKRDESIMDNYYLNNYPNLKDSNINLINTMTHALNQNFIQRSLQDGTSLTVESINQADKDYIYQMVSQGILKPLDETKELFEQVITGHANANARIEAAQKKINQLHKEQFKALKDGDIDTANHLAELIKSEQNTISIWEDYIKDTMFIVDETSRELQMYQKAEELGLTDENGKFYDKKLQILQHNIKVQQALKSKEEKILALEAERAQIHKRLEEKYSKQEPEEESSFQRFKRQRSEQRKEAAEKRINDLKEQYDSESEARKEEYKKNVGLSATEKNITNQKLIGQQFLNALNLISKDNKKGYELLEQVPFQDIGGSQMGFQNADADLDIDKESRQRAVDIIATMQQQQKELPPILRKFVDISSHYQDIDVSKNLLADITSAIKDGFREVNSQMGDFLRTQAAQTEQEEREKLGTVQIGAEDYEPITPFDDNVTRINDNTFGKVTEESAWKMRTDKEEKEQKVVKEISTQQSLGKPLTGYEDYVPEDEGDYSQFNPTIWKNPKTGESVVFEVSTDTTTEYDSDYRQDDDRYEDYWITLKEEEKKLLEERLEQQRKIVEAMNKIVANQTAKNAALEQQLEIAELEKARLEAEIEQMGNKDHADYVAKQKGKEIEQAQKLQEMQQELLGIDADTYNAMTVAAKRKKEREDFWEEIEREEYLSSPEFKEENRGFIETHKHQLGIATTKEEDRQKLDEEATKRAKVDARYNRFSHISGVSVGTYENEVDESIKEEALKKYGHLYGGTYGVNADYEGLSFLEKEKMKLDHKYGKEYIGGSGEDDIPIKRKQSLGERIARWSLGTRAKINELPEKIPDKSEEAAVLRERLGGTQEKLQNIIGPMETFNDGLSRAAEIFPPLSGVAWGFNTALEFMYGIQSALEFVQLLLNSEKFVEILTNAGLVSAETAVNIAKGTETATTLLLTGAIGALEALLAGPVLIVIGIIIAALAVLYISEKNHAEALKANKKALEESSKSMNAAQAAYKSARNARISETNAAKKHQNALKESIALNHLAAERRKRLSEVEKKAMLEHDALWGETNSIRTGVQTGNGIGGIIGFISPLTKLLAGEYENISDKHSENIKQITSIVDSANTDKGFWQNAWDNYDNQYASQVNAYYNEHAREFATMDTFSPQLEKLYQAETQAQKIYGQEGARNSEMFLKAMQEAATDTGLSGDELAQYLDYMQTEANVENARETAKAGFGQIQASIQQKAMQKLYPDGDRMGDLGSVENAMVLAAVEDEARKAKTDLWQSAMLEVTQAIYAAMRLDFDSAGKHWDAAFTYYDGMQEIDKNKEKIAQESLSIAQEDIRKDYGTQSYSFYGDTPFGGAVASAKSAGMKVVNHGSSQTSITEHTSSNTSLSNSYNDAADIAQKQLDTAAEALQEDYGAQNNENHIGLIDRALKFAANLHPAVGFITSLFGDDATESTTTESSQPVINKYEININTININTEDNPEKIKTAFMNLMIEMSEQITPRYVSRTTGQMSNTNEQSNGTEINYNNNNPNNI